VTALPKSQTFELRSTRPQGTGGMMFGARRQIGRTANQPSLGIVDGRVFGGIVTNHQ